MKAAHVQLQLSVGDEVSCSAHEILESLNAIDSAVFASHIICDLDMKYFMGGGRRRLLLLVNRRQ